MRRYGLLDNVLKEFTPKELADYIFNNNREYLSELLDNANWCMIDDTLKELDDEGQMLMDERDTRIEIDGIIHEHKELYYDAI